MFDNVKHQLGIIEQCQLDLPAENINVGFRK
jgi:hypothetical protein